MYAPGGSIMAEIPGECCITRAQRVSLKFNNTGACNQHQAVIKVEICFAMTQVSIVARYNRPYLTPVSKLVLVTQGALLS